MSLTVLFLAACLGWVVFQVLYTRSHRRNLERHNEEIKRIYAKHGYGRKDDA